MKILAIDTSSNVCSVCLSENDNLIRILEIKDKKTHSEKLMPLVKELLDTTGTQLSEINLIACDKGPGSFTGIRIGISSIKAMAEVFNIGIVGVSSLESLSYNEEFDGITCSLIDARNNQVYCGIFDCRDRTAENANKYIADDILVVLDIVQQYQQNILFIGNGATLHKDIIKEKFQTRAYFSENNEQTSISIGKCAYQKYLKNEIETADSITPLYLRKSQAERMQDLEKLKNQ